MVDRKTASRLQIHDALRQRGFERAFDADGGPGYAGLLDPTDLKIPISIWIDDIDFVEYPLIRVDRDFFDRDRVVPHLLGPNRSLCYYGKGSVVLDRYNPGGTVLQCLDQAEKVLRDAVRGRSEADFIDEFQAYWGNTFVYIDLPDGYIGPARLQSARLDRKDGSALVLSRGRSWLVPDVARKHRSSSTGAPVIVVSVEHPMTVAQSESWPPETLRELNSWLHRTAPALVGRLEEVLRSEDCLSANVLVRAPNGLFCYRVFVPQYLRKPEFLKTRRKMLPEVMERNPSSTQLERFVGVRTDAGYLFSRNLGSMINLTDKRILLIGCGTIGGFLAQQLAQCGAGAGQGYLSLVDSDVLSTGNLGRHLLGVPYLGRNKAEACAEFLLEQLPPLAIESYAGNVLAQKLSWDRYDLVIDATGEEALSLALNEHAVQSRPSSPPHLFVWLLGNGAIAQCLMTGEPERACLKCLKPELAGPPRYRALRPGSSLETISNLGCGDAEYIPFPVSRSVAAAALACELTIDWVNGNAGNRFRSLTLDSRRAFQVQNGSPTYLNACPACGVRS